MLIPGMATDTAPLTFPARPWAVIKKLPSPAVSFTMSLLPSFNAKTTSVAPTRTMVSPASLTSLSNAKSPVNVWPRIVNSMPVPSTRKYGPAGRFKSMVFEPTVNCSLTDTFVVFTDKPKVPANETSGMFSRATVASSFPASPEAVTMNDPVPLVTDT